MSNSSNIIGFASQYYTLWSYRTDTRYVTDSHGNHRPSYSETRYTFHKNVSTDIEKVKLIYPNLPIDESLRGKHCSFVIKGTEDLSPELIKFGKYSGLTISEIASTDFNYLMWLRDNCYSSKTKELINELPIVIEFDETVRLKEESIFTDRINSFITMGFHTIRFEYNPNQLLSSIISDGGYDIEFSKDCPKFIIDSLEANKYNRENYGQERVPEKKFATAYGYIDETKYLVVFPEYTQVNGLYPYKMAYIDGGIQKTKNKEFTTQFVPVGFTHYRDNTKPLFQIICAV